MHREWWCNMFQHIEPDCLSLLMGVVNQTKNMHQLIVIAAISMTVAIIILKWNGHDVVYI